MFFNIFLSGNKQWGSHVAESFAKSDGVSWHLVVLIRWSHQEMFLKVFNSLHPNCCPTIRSWLREGIPVQFICWEVLLKIKQNHILLGTVFSREDATLSVADPSCSHLWTKGKGAFFRGKKALISFQYFLGQSRWFFSIQTQVFSLPFSEST